MTDWGSDYQVVEALLAGLQHDQRVYLVTVIDTWGSAPRRPGALMVIHSDGRFTGSVSGGCVEDDLAHRVMRGEFEDGPPLLESYGIKQEQSQRVGLPCGGQLTILIERIDDAADFIQVRSALNSRQRITREVDISTGESLLSDRFVEIGFEFDCNRIVKMFGPQWRMLLIGAGELSSQVAQLGLSLDYDITICDPRPEYAQDWTVAGAHFTSKATGDAVTRFKPDAYSIVLSLAHSAALDDAALAAALQTDAFYVGALGSKGTQRSLGQRLRKMGITEAELARLHGPVGLDIGSRSPVEISIAIIADLIRQRNRSQ